MFCYACIASQASCSCSTIIPLAPFNLHAYVLGRVIFSKILIYLRINCLTNIGFVECAIPSVPFSLHALILGFVIFSMLLVSVLCLTSTLYFTLCYSVMFLLSATGFVQYYSLWLL